MSEILFINQSIINKFYISNLKLNIINPDDYKLIVIDFRLEIIENFNKNHLQKINSVGLKIQTLTKIPVIVILNSWFRNTELCNKIEIPYLFFDIFALEVFLKLFKHKLSPINETWSYNKNNSFLMLIGKPHIPHRLLILYKLVKEGCIDKTSTNYTFKINKNNDTYAELKALMQGTLTHKELYYFIRQYEKDLDLEFDKDKTEDFHYTGIPYNVNIFKNSNFQIILESYCNIDHRPFITEKTWISIVNKMPFIMTPNSGACKLLENLGFNNFTNFLPYKHYNQPFNLYETIENIKFWNSKIQIYKDEIKLATEYNYNIFVDLCKKNLNKFDKMLQDYKINIQPETLFLGYKNYYPNIYL